MSDRDALLAAIRANPDEDTPRLVYADWLEENGHAKRAAFIRAEIAHYRTETADTATNAIYDFLDTQYADSLDRINWTATDADLGARLAAEVANRKLPFHLTAKDEGIPRVKGVTIKNHDRGFFDYVWAENTAAFLKHAEAIFCAAPITSANFDELTVDQAQELVAAGYLAHFRELCLGSEVESEALRVLGSHKDAVCVRKLEFESYSANSAISAPLADGRYWSGLEYLDIVDAEDNDEPPDSEQLADLFGRRPFRGLRRLAAWGCNLDDDAIKAIAKNIPELRFLDVALNQITGDGAAAVAASKTLRHLRYLDLSSCNLADGTVAAALINSPALPNLNVLRLGGNDIRNLHAKTLAKPGRGPGLRVLDLDGVRLNGAGAEALAKCPAVRGLWFLVLQADTTPDALVRFFRHAAFERLTYLDLSGVGLDAAGAKALAAWPGAASLQWLDVDNNAIGEAGAKALANSPHLTGLKHLQASGRGVALLKKRFKKVFG